MRATGRSSRRGRTRLTKRAVVLKHADFEGPGAIAGLVGEQGYRLEVRSLHRGDGVPLDLGPDELLIVMGGSMGVSDLERPEYPYLRAEVQLLRQRVLEEAPVLGVCLGAQLLAHAAGGAVYPMLSADRSHRLYEVGWGRIWFHHSPEDAVLAGMPAEMPMLHWHGDTFDLPPGAHLLASSAVCRNQAFRIGRRMFGLQFHCETTAQDVESFLQADRDYVVKANGPDGPANLRRETARAIDAFRADGDRLLRNIVGAMSAR
jgi:GMP synthase (glutamine-hydrolysing)